MIYCLQKEERKVTQMKVNVQNLPATHKTYVVARPCDGDLWYWGSWDSEETAHTIANEVGGVVVYDEDE